MSTFWIIVRALVLYLLVVKVAQVLVRAAGY